MLIPLIMKKIALGITFWAGAVFFCVCNGQTGAATGGTTDTNILNSEKARESYAVGMSLGTSVKRAGLDLDVDLMVRGLRDAQSASGATLMTQQDMMAAMGQLRQQAAMIHQQEQMEEAKKNQAEGEHFLAENKTKPGVVTLPDGLQYKVITEGSGETPGPDDTVTVNYRGTFVNGQEFDSSAKSGHPAQFPVGRVIHGWTEALEKMKVGSKWELYIPADLAYGPQGRPGIEPNSTLIFEVELLSVKHQAPPPHPQPLTSDIIRVPSAEEMKKGAKVETIKASDVEKMQQQSATN